MLPVTMTYRPWRIESLTLKDFRHRQDLHSRIKPPHNVQASGFRYQLLKV